MFASVYACFALIAVDCDVNQSYPIRLPRLWSKTTLCAVFDLDPFLVDLPVSFEAYLADKCLKYISGSCSPCVGCAMLPWRRSIDDA